jgi:endo-1,4-beta-xylanase
MSAILLACTAPKPQSEPGLKDALADKFYIGTAMNSAQILGEDTLAIAIIKQHFNSVVAENVMKSEVIQPVEGEFDFSQADKFVDFATANKMHVVGHTLIWHSQAPNWFFTNADGSDVSAEVLTERMKTHIQTLVKRYKGRVHGWDVVNEAIMDDGSWRESEFYRLLGEDFIQLAFRFAHEADPEAELYYNDYSMAHPAKCAAVVKIVKNLQEQGIRIDGIGMQGHMNMEFPTYDAFEKSILAFSELGVKVMITEFDISVLPSPGPNVGAEISLNYEYQKEINPYSEGLPDSVAQALHDRYARFFQLFLKHSDKISRVTLWGVADHQSWRNYWPVRGRTDYPLLFDRSYQPKPLVNDLINKTL